MEHLILRKENQAKVLNKNQVLILSKIQLNFRQRCLFNVLISQILKHKDNQLEVYETTATEIRKYLCIDKDTYNYEEMKRDLLSLMDKKIVWTKAGRESNFFSAYVPIYKIVYDDGNIKFNVSQDFVTHVTEFKNYGKINLFLQKDFTSKYSLILYEIASGCFIQELGRGSTDWLEIPTLRQIFGAYKEINGKTVELYKDYRVFKRDVIALAVKDCNEHSPYITTIRTRTENKKVSHIQFLFELKADKTANVKNIKKPFNKYQLDLNNPTVKTLVAKGVNEKNIKIFIDEGFMEELETTVRTMENLDYIQDYPKYFMKIMQSLVLKSANNANLEFLKSLF